MLPSAALMPADSPMKAECRYHASIEHLCVGDLAGVLQGLCMLACGATQWDMVCQTCIVH